MDEFGIYNDEGMVEGPFYSRAAAEKVAATYHPDDEVAVHKIGEVEEDDE